jgi:hypothetical protein
MYSKSLIDREIWEGTQDFSINVFQETSCSVQGVGCKWLRGSLYHRSLKVAKLSNLARWLANTDI